MRDMNKLRRDIEPIVIVLSGWLTVVAIAILINELIRSVL